MSFTSCYNKVEEASYESKFFFSSPKDKATVQSLSGNTHQDTILMSVKKDGSTRSVLREKLILNEPVMEYIQTMRQCTFMHTLMTNTAYTKFYQMEHYRRFIH